MRIVADLTAEVPDTNAHHFKLEKHSTQNGDFLFYGYNASKSAVVRNSGTIFFNNWMPCEFAQTKDHNGFNALEYDQKFDLVYGICPYTVEWLNDMHGIERYKYGFYPFNKDIIPKEQDKKFDVIYHGGIHGKEHEDCLRSISKFKYRYATMTHHINQRTQQHLHMATNTNMPFLEKIKLVGQCKASVCYNIVHNEERHKNNIRSYPQWQNNVAFSGVNSSNLMPQFKTRMHEAAIAKTLNLVYYDSWNVAEDYYKPGKEFLYFSTPEELEELIDEISYNWEDYHDIVEAAYERAMNYTTDKFVKLVESGQDWKGGVC